MSPTKAGPVNATTDSKTGLRTYDWQGQRLTSATSLRRLVGMPFPLATWMQDQAIKAAISHAGVLGQVLNDDGPDATAKWLRSLAMGERDAAANRGTAVHEAAANHLLPAQVGAEVAGPLAQFYDFMQYSGAVEVFAERQVFNLSLGYAGSIDSLLRIGPPIFKHPRLLVTDYKTGKGIYVDHALQLMLYALGEFIGENDVIDPNDTLALQQADGIALLHLSDTDWELVEIGVTPRLRRAVLAMITFARWQQDNPSIDTLVAGRHTK